ncbi:MAG TPA: pitrilysin family protein [Gemmatimonadaceae bacterium]|nr:pitrilysin family protein [Gemmatimonadaceae bacterium]
MTRSRLLGYSSCLLSFVFAVSAGAQAPPKLKFEKYTLPNGLEVILHEDHSTPIVTVDTWYHVGSGDEKPGRTGFAHLFEHVMFMGSEHVPVGEFDKQLEAAGADNNGSTSEDRTNYYESLPSNALPLALWLDSDRMGFLLSPMDQAKLDLQRDVVKNERRQRVDNVPYGRADETILAALYPKGHPYSWSVIGSMQDLSAASVEDVKQFFRTYYAPNNATLTIAGDFDPVETKKLVAAYFSGIPRGPAMPARPQVAPITLAKDTFLVLEDKVQLPRVFYDWPTVKIFDPDDAPLDMLAAVLASGKNSRLYKRLVFDMQIAQSVFASQQSGKLASKFEIDVAPKPGQSVAAIDKVVQEEIQKIMNAPVDARELQRARNSFRASFLNRISSILGKSEVLNTYNYFVGNPDYIQQDAERYEHVTAADVQRVAKKYLGRPKVVLTVVPEGKKELMLTSTGSATQ